MSAIAIADYGVERERSRMSRLDGDAMEDEPVGGKNDISDNGVNFPCLSTLALPNGAHDDMDEGGGLVNDLTWWRWPIE